MHCVIVKKFLSNFVHAEYKDDMDMYYSQLSPRLNFGETDAQDEFRFRSVNQQKEESPNQYRKQTICLLYFILSINMLWRPIWSPDYMWAISDG